MLAGRAFGAARPAAVDVPFVTVPGTVAAMRHATAGDTVADVFLAADVDHAVAVRAAGVGTGGGRRVGEAVAVVIHTDVADLCGAGGRAPPPPGRVGAAREVPEVRPVRPHPPDPGRAGVPPTRA